MLIMALSRMPHAWRTELRYAAEACEIATVLNIIDRIRQEDEHLAEALTILVRKYQFDMLQELCGSIEV